MKSKHVSTKGSSKNQPAWPTLQEQLAAANVVPNSALEKLIKENQDFSTLRPEEADDSIGLPPWLRVHWRKTHPEGKYSANDKSGGYPRVLQRTHAWMLSHQSLKSEGEEGTL